MRRREMFIKYVDGLVDEGYASDSSTVGIRSFFSQFVHTFDYDNRNDCSIINDRSSDDLQRRQISAHLKSPKDLGNLGDRYRNPIGSVRSAAYKRKSVTLSSRK